MCVGGGGGRREIVEKLRCCVKRTLLLVLFRKRDSERDRQTDRQADGDSERETDRDRQTDRQSHREKETLTRLNNSNQTKPRTNASIIFSWNSPLRLQTLQSGASHRPEEFSSPFTDSPKWCISQARGVFFSVYRLSKVAHLTGQRSFLLQTQNLHLCREAENFRSGVFTE